METTVKERLIQFLSYKKIGQKKFAETCGLSAGYVNAIRKSIQPDKISKIAMQFPELNTGWLLTGNGEMLNTSEIKPVSNVEFLNIPFLPIHAQGGYGRGYGDHEYIESLPTYPVIVDKNYKGKYRVFEVDGDSMDDGTRNAIYNGDKILCREVKRELWTSKLHYKDWYFVICMKNDGITIKQITAHDVEKAIIRCHPLNPIFDDFEVDLNEVAELYNVIKIVERSARL
jgi:hypothetical protein